MSTPAAARLIAARDARQQSDYIFDFWTALGWTILSCGIYGFYVWYRLVERMREHNRRRLAFLEAANEAAWNRANEQGRAEELRPRFERVGADLQVMRSLSGEFRDPAIWTVLLLIGSTIVMFIIYWLLDADLIKHGAAEADAEQQLSELFSILGMGTVVAPPSPGPKPPHQYAMRIVATLLTCGFYSYWWLADLMREGNDHFRRDWAWEDAVVVAVA
ncbi:MAG TPA: hypothetical protein VM345_15675 [Acidimicrobiales bacterium]|jgi:hypothetical protein|nr:hypothetical protein [Acidimicrobiales bacterium]